VSAHARFVFCLDHIVGRLLPLLLVAWACTGDIGDRVQVDAIHRPGDPPLPITCEEPAPGRSPLRRLTAVEYDNTIRDLLGDTTGPATRMLPPELGSGFSNNADVRTVGTSLARGYLDVAEDVSSRVNLAALTGDCADEDACARSWLESFVPRAYRHPVEAAELDRLFAVYSSAKTSWGHEKAIELTLQVILQSSHFLYRVELPPASAAPGSVERLDAHEIAARLSYLLWATMPDDGLTAAAAAGELDDPAGIETHARRMLADPRADGVVARFFDEWLELDRLDGLVKDEEVYPSWDVDVTPQLMKEETRAFVREVFASEGASYRALLSADFTMANGALADFYGLSGPTGDAFERVPLDPTYHAGILTQGAVLAPRSRAYESDPIHRGMFVRARLFCGDVPRLPEGLMVEPPDPDPSLTTRERLRVHREDPTCATCHSLLDPLGFAFEHFDGTGRFRETENDLPIDATGEIALTDVDGTYDGAPDLASRLLSSDQAQGCFVRQWFRFAHGRSESDDFDRCSLESLETAFVEASFDIRELIVNLTQTDAFLYRVATAPSLSGEEEP
jgi:hypothetical protein